MPAYRERYGVAPEDSGRHDPRGRQEPRERRPEPPRAVPPGGNEGGHRAVPGRGRGTRRDGLLGRGRRRRGRDRDPGRGRAQVHRYAPYIEALALVTGDGSGAADPRYDYTSFPEVVACARQAYAQAGITDPRRELALAEVHDCFTPTEIILMEDLGFAERGHAWRDVLDGVSTGTASCR